MLTDEAGVVRIQLTGGGGPRSKDARVLADGQHGTLTLKSNGAALELHDDAGKMTVRLRDGAVVAHKVLALDDVFIGDVLDPTSGLSVKTRLEDLEKRLSAVEKKVAGV